MYHRYGRHGPDAWKSRRQRRFQQRLPAVIPTLAIQFQVPTSGERIIVIVVMSQENPEDFDQNNPPIQLHREQSRELQPVSDNSPLANLARMQALNDIEDIKALSEREGQVVIVDEDVPKRAKVLARDWVNNYNKSGELGVEKYKQWLERYQAAYLDQFEKERASLAENVRSFPDAKAAQLARKARQDSKSISFPSTGRGLQHQRDLAVVSALHALELCTNLEEHLAQIHPYVDIYAEAFSNPREEVVWPDPASF